MKLQLTDKTRTVEIRRKRSKLVHEEQAGLVVVDFGAGIGL